MLVCSQCLSKEIKYLDGSSKYSWCEDCVPRGCSCNDEHFFTVSETTINDDNQFEEHTYLEELNNVIDRCENEDGNYQIFYSKTGVLFDDKKNSYILSLNNADFKEISLDFLKDNKDDIVNNISGAIKITPVDENGKEYPCVEIMDINIDEDDRYIGAKFYSLAHSQEFTINYLYPKGKFRASADNHNDFFYNSYGMDEESITFDLLIDAEYEVDRPEFILLRKFVFHTSNNEFLIDTFNSYVKIKGDSCVEFLDEFNDDFGIFCESFNDDFEEYEDLKVFVLEKFKDYMKPFLREDVDDKIFNILFYAFVTYHTSQRAIIDDYVYSIDSFGCSDDEEDKSFNYSQRKSAFTQVFLILYHHIEEDDEDC